MVEAIYRCPICGREFEKWDEAQECEKLCTAEHALGMQCAELLNDIQRRCKINNIRLEFVGDAAVMAYYNASNRSIEFCIPPSGKEAQK